MKSKHGDNVLLEISERFQKQGLCPHNAHLCAVAILNASQEQEKFPEVLAEMLDDESDKLLISFASGYMFAQWEYEKLLPN